MQCMLSLLESLKMRRRILAQYFKRMKHETTKGVHDPFYSLTLSVDPYPALICIKHLLNKRNHNILQQSSNSSNYLIDE